MSERITNSFEGGLSNDLDPKISKNNTYNLSVNGKLIYNENGSLSWQNADGNQKSIVLDNFFVCIGHAIFTDKIILFTQSTFNSIGKIIAVRIDNESQFGLTTILYSSGDFNFSLEHKIKALALEESSSLQRVYFTDDYNEPRSFTFKDENGIFTAITPSVASMSISVNFNIGIIKLKEITQDGSLLSGKYQYTYRCVSEDGYVTPWVPVSRHFVLSTNKIPQVYEDSNDFGFGSTNQPSGKSINITIEKVDTRFKKIQVAYLYSKINTDVESSSIFYDELINNQPTINIKHSSITNSGVPVDLSAISDRKESIIKAKEILIKDNRLWLGNTETTDIFVLPNSVLANLTVRATWRSVKVDNNSINGIGNDGWGLPISGTLPTTCYTHRLKYVNKFGVPKYETYNITNDYASFRGVQVEHLYSGYFRDEKYRFGIVFFDKKGNPLFATHLADVKFPPQFQSQSNLNPTIYWDRLKEDGTIESKNYIYNLSAGEPYYKFAASSNCIQNTIGSDLLVEQPQSTTSLNLSGSQINTAFARSMGVEFGGIDVTDIKDKISGFQIVRVARDEENETIKMQGIINQCIYRGKYQEGTNTDIVGPFPNAWVPALEQYTGSFYNQKLVDILCGDTAPGAETADSRLITLAPQYYTIDFPDYMVNNIVPTINKGTDKIKVAATSFSSYIGSLGSSYIQWASDHHVHKFYNQQNPLYFQQSGQTWGNSTRGYYNESYDIEISMTIGDDKPIEGTKKFTKFSHMGGPSSGFNYNYSSHFSFDQAIGEERKLLNAYNFAQSLFFKLNKPFILYDNSITDPSAHAGNVIVNLKREISSQYGGLSKLALENNVFETTGHFQEVNSSVLTDITTNTNKQIFNNIEVFGGDCYVDFFGYCRLTPLNRLSEGQYATISQEEDYHDMEIHDDYSVASYHPIESKYNLQMRFAEKVGFPIHSAVGTKTTKYLAGEDNGNYKMANGIHTPGGTLTGRAETFALNAILLHKHTVYNFFAQPSNYIAKFDYPTRWHWSNEKKPYSEKIDRFREFEELSNFDLDASYGEITGSALLFNSAYSIQKKAFGKLRINERAVVSAVEGQQVTLGEPTLMNGIDYISTTFGTQHQFSVSSSDKSIYWADARMNKLIKFGQDGLNILSDIGNIHSFIKPYLNKVIGIDNISLDEYSSGGIISYIDNENNNVYFTIRVPYMDNVHEYLISDVPTRKGTNKSLTISYNEDLNVFQSIHSFYPKHAFSFANKFYTQGYLKNAQDIEENAFFVHTINKKCKYYDYTYYSKLAFNVNKMANATKIFDNGSLNINSTGYQLLDMIYLQTETQFHEINIKDEIVNINGYSIENRAKYRLDNLKFPYRQKNKLDRLNGNYLNFTLILKNTENILFSLTSVDSIIRTQKRT